MAKESFWKKINPFTSSVKLADAPAKVRTIHLEDTGSSGTDLTSGVIQEDYLQKIEGTEGADIFDKMRRSDPKVKMSISAVMNPIKSANWEIMPAEETGDDDEAKFQADLVRKCIFESQDKRWKTLLHEILTMIVYGYSLFERTHRVIFDDPEFGTHIGLKNMAYRSQRTIERWNVDRETGVLETVTQQAFGDAQKTNVDIPAKFLTVFSLDREGTNFEGVSMLRSAYGPWLRKQCYLKLMAIGIEKFAVPTPILSVPEGKQGSEEFTEFKAVLQRYVSHQNNYVTKPEGWEIEFLNSNFDASKVQAAIDAENKEIVNAFMANFLELGQNGSGSYALSYDLSDFFLGGIEHIASQICEIFNDEIIPELIDLNFPDVEKYPIMNCSGISDKAGKELAETLKILAESQYLKPTDKDEEHLRNRYKLPERSEEGVREVNRQTNAFGLSEKKKTSDIKLAETPRGQIDRSSKEIRDVMQRHLEGMGRDLAKRVRVKLQGLPKSRQLNAISGMSSQGVNKFKKELRDVLAKESAKSLTEARKEIPGGDKIKLAEFEDLPPSIQLKLINRSKLLVETQTADLEKSVFFSFSGSVESTNDPLLVEKDMNDSVDSFMKSASVVAAAGNAAGFTVNEARQAFFFTDESLGKINAFRFVNPNPASPICRDLKGRVFAKDDPESARFFPPLHHNCKSYLVPVFSEAKIDPRGLKPSNAKVEKSITLSESNICCAESHDIELQEDAPLVLQSVIVSKEQFPTLEQAKKRAARFGKIRKVDETSTSFRFRQRDPEDFVEGSFVTINKENRPGLPEGVSLVLGKLA